MGRTRTGKVKTFLAGAGHRVKLGLWRGFARPSKKKLLESLRARIKDAGSWQELQLLKETVFALRERKELPKVALEMLYRAMERNPLHKQLPYPELGVRMLVTSINRDPDGKIVEFPKRKRKLEK